MNATGFSGLMCETVSGSVGSNMPVILPGISPGETNQSADFAACLDDQLPDIEELDEHSGKAIHSTATPDQVLQAMLSTAGLIPAAPPVPVSPELSTERGEVESGQHANSEKQSVIQTSCERVLAPGSDRMSEVASTAVQSSEPQPTSTLAYAGLMPLEKSPLSACEQKMAKPVDSHESVTSDSRETPATHVVSPERRLETVAGAAEGQTFLPGKNVPAAVGTAADFSRQSIAPSQSSAFVAPEGVASIVKKDEKLRETTLIRSSRQVGGKDGTSVAKSFSAMPAQMTDEQKQEISLVLKAAPVREFPAFAEAGEKNVLVMQSGLELPPDRFSSAESDVEMSSVTAAAGHERIDKLQELITKEVRFFRQSGAQVLEMVVEPAPDIRIKLHLELQDGHIKAALSSADGDGSWLQSHWAELKESLSGQGVTLRQFDSETPSNPQRSPSFDAQFGSRQEEHARASAPFDQTEAQGGSSTSRSRSSFVPTARKAGNDTRQILESWA
ncbi:MAG TPA: hypothetical protein VGH19_09850 [Verrucomicrobiae bacterium]